MANRKPRHPARRARMNAGLLSVAAFVGIGTGIAARTATTAPAPAAGTDVTAGGVTARRDPSIGTGGPTWYAPPVTSTGGS